MSKVKISIAIKDCTQCPKCGYDRTKGAGFAYDYFCKLVPDSTADYGFKVTSGYVEWEKDMNPVPVWCPLRTDKKEIEKEEQEKIMGVGI